VPYAITYDRDRRGGVEVVSTVGAWFAGAAEFAAAAGDVHRVEGWHEPERCAGRGS
jgi:hypothetical protein